MVYSVKICVKEEKYEWREEEFFFLKKERVEESIESLKKSLFEL